MIDEFQTDIVTKDDPYKGSHAAILVSALAKQAGVARLDDDAKLDQKRRTLNAFGWVEGVKAFDVLVKDKRIPKPPKKDGSP